LPQVNRLSASCSHIQALIIDEGKEGSLVPVIRAAVRGLDFSTSASEPAPGNLRPGEEPESDPTKLSVMSQAHVELGVNYFNKDIEEWEPFIEDFEVEYEEDVEGLVTKRNIKIADRGLSVNFSPEVAKCIGDINNIWFNAKEAAHAHEQASNGDQDNF
jgi:hypothetical protein